MDKLYNNLPEKSKTKPQWKRDEVASNVIDFEASKMELSERKFSEERNIPRTTLQYWLQRKEKLDASAMMISFFESPDGVAFLHRLIVALHFEFTKHGIASIRNICNFLELSGLSAFVASCYGVHQKMSKILDSAIIEFAQTEQKRMSAQMPRKKITLCEDETFHPEVCLVAMEAVSNFIILEKYVANRDGETWNKAIEEALCGLPVDVIQSSSDEGRGLLNHVQKGLKVNHSPDTFHVPYEISKGTNGALCSAVKQAEKEYEMAQKRTHEEKERMARYESQQKRPVGRRPAFEKKIADAEPAEQQAEEMLYQAKQNQALVQTAKAEIG
jgi:hypothetical protein